MKKNKLTVSFISANEYTLSNLSRNISHFMYNKYDVNIYDTPVSEIKNIIKKSDYIFIDHDSKLLDKVNIKKTKVIMVPDSIFNFNRYGLLNDELTPKEEKKLIKRYSKISYAVSCSYLQSEQLTRAYNLDSSKLIELGSPVIDSLNGNKVLTEIENLMQRYPETITEYSILFIPNEKSKIEDNIEYIDFINNLKLLRNNFNIYYYLSDDVLNRFKKKEINGTLIDKEDINNFLNIVNYSIMNNSRYLTTALYLKRNVIYLKQDNPAYDVASLNLHNVNDVHECLAVIDNNLESRVDYSKFRKNYVGFNDEAISRKVIVEMFKGHDA